MLILKGRAKVSEPIQRFLVEDETLALVPGMVAETDGSSGMAFSWSGIGVFQLEANSILTFERLRDFSGGKELLPRLRVPTGGLTGALRNEKVRLEIVVAHPPYILAITPQSPPAAFRIKGDGTAINLGATAALATGLRSVKAQRMDAGSLYDPRRDTVEPAPESELDLFRAVVRQFRELERKTELRK